MFSDWHFFSTETSHGDFLTPFSIPKFMLFQGHAWSKELDVPGSRGVCGAMIFKGNAKFCVWGLHPIQQGNNVPRQKKWWPWSCLINQDDSSTIVSMLKYQEVNTCFVHCRFQHPSLFHSWIIIESEIEPWSSWSARQHFCKLPRWDLPRNPCELLQTKWRCALKPTMLLRSFGEDWSLKLTGPGTFAYICHV